MSALMLGLGIPSLVELKRFRDSEATVLATVTESRSRQTAWGLEHGLRYSFQLETNPGVTYRRSELLTDDLWSTVPKEEWSEALAKGVVLVRYVPTRPTNNAVANAPPSWLDESAPLLFGGLFLFLTIKAQRRRDSCVDPIWKTCEAWKKLEPK